MPFKIKLFIITILLTSITIFLASSTFAIEEKKVRGHRGPIGKEELHSKLKAIHDKKGKSVEGYVIEGKDIISIIEKTDIDIKIKNSIIKGGLDFTKLPKIHSDRLKLPDGWSEDGKEKWRMKQRKNKPFYQATNKISIVNSDIRSARSQNEMYCVNTSQTFFSGDANFSEATFSGDAKFSEATFSGVANFSKATFSGVAEFYAATFSEDAKFYAATFSEGAAFSSAIFSEGAEFYAATFNRSVSFMSATFSRSVSFMSATFSGNAVFRATFSGYADFSYATFSEDARFNSATFSRSISFMSATFSGSANFMSATFSGSASFMFATFSGYASFMFATFSGYASFYSATFSKDADFSMASFIKLAYFKKSRFLSNLLFRNVDFREYADLRNTQIRRLDCNSVDSPTVIKGRLDFRNSIILEAHIQDFIFEKNVYFSDSKFGVFIGKEKMEGVSKTDKKSDKRNTKVESSVATVFRFVTFESYADFKRTEFWGNTAFENVNFIQDANFTDADFKARKDGSKQKFSLSYLSFKNLFIKWNQLPNIRCWATDSSDRIKSFVEIKEEQKKSQRVVNNEETKEKIKN